MHALTAIRTLTLSLTLTLTLSLTLTLKLTPRMLPLSEYNMAYKDTVLRVLSSFLWPTFVVTQLYSNDMNINSVIGILFNTFFVGYSIVSFFETAAATAVRLVVLRLFEPDAFKLTPRIPAIFLPWKLSESSYFPNRKTMVLFSLLNTCLMAPIVEEGFKLIILRLCVRGNFNISEPSERLSEEIGKDKQETKSHLNNGFNDKASIEEKTDTDINVASNTKSG
jgi:hypothetical protein